MNYDFNISYPQLPFEKKVIVNTINPYSYCIAQRDHLFKDALTTSDILLPDGIGIVWAAKVLNI